MSAEVPPTNDSNVYEGAIGIGMYTKEEDQEELAAQCIERAND